MNKDKTIWALFDDGYGSWNKLEKDNIISIGINDNNDWKNYFKIDLSLTNPNLLKELDKLPKPDVIIASPPCESWSIADCNGRIYNSDLTTKNNDYYINYNKTAHPNKRRNFINKEISRIIGESTIGGVMSIIKHFNPEIWVIENPASSLIWKFIEDKWNFKGVKNDTYYYNYDVNFSKKHTNFLSNKNLHLKKEILKDGYNIDRMKRVGYDERSKIPKTLIEEIYIKVNNGEK